MPESKAGRIPILAKKHYCWPEKDNESEFPEKRFLVAAVRRGLG